jgi:hypothetical protein
MRHWTYMLIFRLIFLSNYWWQKSDIWSQASYRYPISWEAFLDPSDSYFLLCIKINKVSKQEVGIWWVQKRYPQYGIPIWSLWPNIRFLPSTVTEASYRYPISWEAFLDPSDSYFLFNDFVDFYTHLTYICICTFFVTFFSATIDDKNLIYGHKLHIGMSYCGKRFWTRQIPNVC